MGGMPQEPPKWSWTQEELNFGLEKSEFHIVWKVTTL